MTGKKFFTGVFIIMMITPFFILHSQQQSFIEPGNDPVSGNRFNTEDYRKFRDLTLKLHYKDASVSSLVSKDTQKTEFRMRKSPTIAVLLSAVVPGAGQFYNRSYWKIPVIAGLIGYFGYEYINNNNKYKDYRDKYAASVTPSNQFGDQNLKSLREFYRNQRDDFVWYFLIVYVVNLVDAYVDAHLFDFDVKEEKLTRYGRTDRELKFLVNFNF